MKFISYFLFLLGIICGLATVIIATTGTWFVLFVGLYTLLKAPELTFWTFIVGFGGILIREILVFIGIIVGVIFTWLFWTLGYAAGAYSLDG
jgi:hypothetical protein